MNLTTFRSYVKYDFKRIDKDTELTQAYNDGIIAVSIKIPHGAYKFQSYLPLIARQEDYPLPSNIIHLIHPVRVMLGSASTDTGFPLNHITKQEYDILYPNPNRTTPDILGRTKDYCIYSGSILVGPLPEVGTNDLLEIDWTKVPTDQSAGTDTPALPDYWREVLKWMTLSRLNHGIGLYQEAQYWRSLYEDNEGNPVSLYRDLLNVEKDKEDRAVGEIKVNSL